MVESYLFKILGNANWGIVVELYVKVVEKKKDTLDQIQITDNIFLDLAKVSYLDQQNKSCLIDGMKWIRSKIRVTTTKVVIIERLVINPTDFQSEGLFFCIASWASRFFNFSLPEYSYTFDKKNNKYVFSYTNLD